MKHIRVPLVLAIAITSCEKPPEAGTSPPTDVDSYGDEDEEFIPDDDPPTHSRRTGAALALAGAMDVRTATGSAG